MGGGGGGGGVMGMVGRWYNHHRGFGGRSHTRVVVVNFFVCVGVDSNTVEAVEEGRVHGLGVLLCDDEGD